MVDGNEVSPIAADDAMHEPRGHIGCIPADLASFDREGAFVDRPRGQVTGGEALAQARGRGCFTIVNHPYGLAPWIAYDWTDLGYDALEVWNGGAGLDVADWRAYDIWRCDLLAGRNPTPVAASDNHRVHTAPPGELLHPALGWPATSVFTTELSWPAVMEGLRAGRVALHEGASRLYLDAYDAQGARTEGDVRWLRLRGRLDPDAGPGVLRALRATACDDPRPEVRPPTVEASTVHQRAVAPGESFDVAVPVDEAGVYTATLVPVDGQRRAALSRAWRR